MSDYRLAFIGCGKRARRFAEGLKEERRCRVVALADPAEEAAAAMVDDYGYQAEVFTDHRQMLKDVQADVVVGALWTVLHLPVFRDCAEAGVKSYFSEKPMAPSWGESLEMARIAERTGCQLTFCHQRRFTKRNRMVRQLVREGVFGEIQRLDLYAPCSLLDCGTHTFDQALSYMGEVPAKRVLGGVNARAETRSFGAPADAGAAGVVLFENGVGAAVISAFREAQDIGGGVRLLGSKGMIEVHWDGACRRAILYDDPSWTFPDPGGEQDGEVMARLIGETLDCLESGRESDISYQKALRATEIIYAFYESARRHETIDLPLAAMDNPVAELQAAVSAAD